MYVMKRPSGGRGEYEVAGPLGDLTPQDLIDREFRVRVGRAGVRATGVVLRLRDGKPRLRIEPQGPIHFHRQVAATALLPKPVREEAVLAGGFPIVFLDRYILRRIHLTDITVAPGRASLQLGDLETQNGTDDVQMVNFTERVRRLEQIQDNSNLLPDLVAGVLTTHRGMLDNAAPLTAAAEETVNSVMTLVQAHGPSFGVEYSYGTDVLPALEAMAGLVAPAPPIPDLPRATRPLPGVVGEAYRPANENPEVPQVDPFVVDPAVKERGLRGHAMTQNALAEYLRGRHLEPKSPRPGDPNFDLAWEDGDRLVVAEVKSLTNVNEERQLRLGVGQVLRYRQVLSRYQREVVAVLAVEKQPQDESWKELCAELGIVLIWPANMANALDALAAPVATP